MVLIFTPLSIAFFMKPPTILKYIKNDYASATTMLGGQDEINSDLNIFYSENLSLVANFVNEFEDRKGDAHSFREKGGASELMADISSNWSSSVRLQLYSMALRLSIIKRWGVWLIIPFMIGCVVGALERKLKTETFGGPVPPIYNTSSHMLLALTSITILWVICPIPIPVSVFPTMGVLFSVFVGLAVANYPNY